MQLTLSPCAQPKFLQPSKCAGGQITVGMYGHFSKAEMSQKVPQLTHM